MCVCVCFFFQQFYVYFAMVAISFFLYFIFFSVWFIPSVYFDAINQILFTMCSNRKMFSNKFMVYQSVFVRLPQTPFTLFQERKRKKWKKEIRIDQEYRICVFMCRHTTIKIWKDFINVPDCAIIFFFLVWLLQAMICSFFPNSMCMCLYQCSCAIKTNFMSNKWH